VKFFILWGGYVNSRIKYTKNKVGVIYHGGIAIPPPETDSFYGGGMIYFKVSEFKSLY